MAKLELLSSELEMILRICRQIAHQALKGEHGYPNFHITKLIEVTPEDVVIEVKYGRRGFDINDSYDTVKAFRIKREALFYPTVWPDVKEPKEQ